MNTKVSGRESLNGAAEPGRDLLEIDVFDGTKSVRAKNRCNASRLETADRTLLPLIERIVVSAWTWSILEVRAAGTHTANNPTTKRSKRARNERLWIERPHSEEESG